MDRPASPKEKNRDRRNPHRQARRRYAGIRRGRVRTVLREGLERGRVRDNARGDGPALRRVRPGVSDRPRYTAGSAPRTRRGGSEHPRSPVDQRQRAGVSLRVHRLGLADRRIARRQRNDLQARYGDGGRGSGRRGGPLARRSGCGRRNVPGQLSRFRAGRPPGVRPPGPGVHRPRVPQPARHPAYGQTTRNATGAYSNGYFGWPRECELGDIAETLDVSKATVSQHLRVAQGKVFETLFED